jgi:hypothetical protein
MKIACRLSVLTFTLGALLLAGSTQANTSGESLCERRLEQCLFYADTPEPCYREYERCVMHWGERAAVAITHKADAPRLRRG